MHLSLNTNPKWHCVHEIQAHAAAPLCIHIQPKLRVMLALRIVRFLSPTEISLDCKGNHINHWRKKAICYNTPNDMPQCTPAYLAV